jgi:hypothetical protein
MPVLSLPEYLGIQEAPQQPVFQRTRQLAQPRSPWERDVQIADAMTQLRQQQPLSQIQAIQNEYDNIMMNAEKIRREREAASQAERAVSALAGLTPESDDYLKQRRQIMTQFPSAVLDPRVQSIMDDSDRMFNARQSSAARMEQERLAAEAARADEIQKRATSLIEMGVPPDQAMRDAQSPYTAAQAKFQRSQKPQGSRYEKALGTIQDLIRSVPEDERYDFVDGKQTVRPEFKALLDKQKQYADAYFREIEGEPVTPSVAPSVTPKPATVAATAAVDQAPAAPKSFKDTMKSASKPPSAAEILKIDDKEIIQDLNDPSADENTYMAALEDPSASEQVKREALDKLKQFAKTPKFPIGTGIGEAKMRIAALNRMVEKGEREIRKIPELKRLNKAWDAEKSDINRYLNEYAKSLGLDADIVAASIAAGEPMEAAFNAQGQRETYRDDFDAFLGRKFGKKGKGALELDAERLFPFQGSEFADDFGMSGPIPGIRSIRKGKTYGDVLDVLLTEKFGQNPSALANRVAPANGGSSVTGQPKIQIGQPRKVQ